MAKISSLQCRTSDVWDFRNGHFRYEGMPGQVILVLCSALKATTMPPLSAPSCTEPDFLGVMFQYLLPLFSEIMQHCTCCRAEVQYSALTIR